MNSLDKAVRAADHLAKQAEFPIPGLPWATPAVCKLIASREYFYRDFYGRFFLYALGNAPFLVGPCGAYVEDALIVATWERSVIRPGYVWKIRKGPAMPGLTADSPELLHSTERGTA